jgi:hypothetical protein
MRSREGGRGWELGDFAGYAGWRWCRGQRGHTPLRPAESKAVSRATVCGIILRSGDAASGCPAPLRVQVGLLVGGPPISTQYRIY